MKRVLLLIVAVVGLFAIALSQAACSDQQIARVQKGAADVQAATTQPIVQAVTPLVPYGRATIALVSALAGIVGTFAPMFARQKKTEAAVVEVAHDTAVSKSDDPFSARTARILAKYGVDTPGTSSAGVQVPQL